MKKSKLYEAIHDEWEEWYRNIPITDLIPLAYIDRHLEEFNLYSSYLKKNDRILEAGCGLGNQLDFLIKKGYRTIGIDYAEIPLRKIKSYDATLPILAADIHEIPFRDKTFRAYVSIGVLEHIETGPLAALKEANRILDKGGIIALSIPSNYLMAKIFSGQKNIISKVKRTIWRFLKKKVNQEIFINTYSRKQLKSFLEEAGFDILSISPTGHDFVWYSLFPFFRKNRCGVPTDFGLKFAYFVRKFFSWRTSFYIFAVAQKRG